MTEHIHRVREVTESVEVPEGYKVCPSCGGKGMLSDYDRGYRSVVHNPRASAKRPCARCLGAGMVKA